MGFLEFINFLHFLKLFWIIAFSLDCANKSHYIEVAQRAIFWNKMWDCGRLWAILRPVFSCFRGQKKLNFLKIYYIVLSKKLHNISFSLILFFWIFHLAKHSQPIVSCSTGDTSLHNYIMTLYVSTVTLAEINQLL